MAIRAACALLAGTLAGCGLKGPLYLPEQSSGIVTRPTQTPPEAASAPNSPQTVDSPQDGAAPAPEVTPPQSVEDEAKKNKDPDKNGTGAIAPPR
ncbi:MAG: lipoprotein [Pseudomonadota bacterium]